MLHQPRGAGKACHARRELSIIECEVSMIDGHTHSISLQQARAILDDLELYSYYELLEIPPDASVDVMTHARHVKRFALQRLKTEPGCSVQLLSDLALLQDRLDEALEVLCDAESPQLLDSGEG